MGTPGDCGLPARGHLQMVVLMDPMEDPDDILRAHRSREKSYLFDVAFDFTATQVRESMVWKHRKDPLHTWPCKGGFSGGPAHLFSNIYSTIRFLELCPFVKVDVYLRDLPCTFAWPDPAWQIACTPVGPHTWLSAETCSVSTHIPVCIQEPPETPHSWPPWARRRTVKPIWTGRACVGVVRES